MFYLLDRFIIQIKQGAISTTLTLIFSCLCILVSAQSGKTKTNKYTPEVTDKNRTERTVGIVKHIYSSKYSSYTEISYLGRILKLNYAIRAYNIGDKLLIEYDPHKVFNAVPLLERPYFEKGELADTTEGILNSVSQDFCYFTYKVYNGSDSMDITILYGERYLAKGMFDTLDIKEKVVYKIIYNKKSKKAEVLFNSIVDSTHQQKNKYLFSALERITNSNPLDAMGDLNECIRLDPQNDYYYYYQIAKAQENIREYKNALEYFTKYIQAKPIDKRGYVSRATVYLKMGNVDEAQKDVNTLFYLNNHDAEAYYLQAVIYYHKKEYQKAIDFYSNAIQYANKLNLEVYYYDRAQARQKLYGKKDKQCKHDYYLSKREAIKNDATKLHGHGTHEESLHNKHNLYVTLTSDNTLTFINSPAQSNMQGEIILPYTINNTPEILDKTFLLNHSSHATSFSLGLLSLEVGGFKRMYARTEMALVLNNGEGPPSTIRSVVGYNIKFTKKDVMILRPEIGFTYFNRKFIIDSIDFNGATQIGIMGKNFEYKKNGDNKKGVAVSFRENVFSLSPSIGLWLFPYSSKLVMRVGLGYNYVFSQNYSIHFKNNNQHLREKFDNLNLQFSNTNGSSSNFFSYNGLFINVGIGIRF